jgi:hypothetical protein
VEPDLHALERAVEQIAVEFAARLVDLLVRAPVSELVSLPRELVVTLPPPAVPAPRRATRPARAASRPRPAVRPTPRRDDPEPDESMEGTITDPAFLLGVISSAPSTTSRSPSSSRRETALLAPAPEASARAVDLRPGESLQESRGGTLVVRRGKRG